MNVRAGIPPINPDMRAHEAAVTDFRDNMWVAMDAAGKLIKAPAGSLPLGIVHKHINLGYTTASPLTKVGDLISYALGNPHQQVYVPVAGTVTPGMLIAVGTGGGYKQAVVGDFIVGYVVKGNLAAGGAASVELGFGGKL